MASSKEKVLELIKRKDEIEKEIAKVVKDAMPNVPLVDKEGFPSKEVDVHAVRIQRNTLARLQTDHREIMKQIETEMLMIHQAKKKSW